MRFAHFRIGGFGRLTRSLVFLSLLILSNLASAETDGLEVGTLETTTGPSNAGQKVVGILDLRPSWKTDQGENYGDNSIELGYRFNPSLAVTYKQEFTNNLYNPTENPGLNLLASDGYFVGYFDELWTSENWSFSYEPRVYLPTLRTRRDAGFQTALFNQLKLGNKVSDTTLIQFSEIPILYSFNRDGFDGEDGPEANPVFENQFELLTEVSFLDGKVLLSFPLKWAQIRYSNFTPGAKFNDGWNHKIWIHPELTYQLFENFALGTAFMSENLAEEDLSRLRIGKGFSEGVAQIILKAEI